MGQALSLVVKCHSVLSSITTTFEQDESAAEEWRNVMNALSVGETYFWREIDQIHALTQTIVPHGIATKPRRTLRIWSAACATGEEP